MTPPQKNIEQHFCAFVLREFGKHSSLKKSGDSYCDSFVNALWKAFNEGCSAEKAVDTNELNKTVNQSLVCPGDE